MKLLTLFFVILPIITDCQTADEYIDLAVKESDLGNNLRAIDYTNKALLLDSINVVALGLRAHCENQLGQYIQAISDLNKCLEIFNKTKIPFLEPALFYFERGIAKFGLKDFPSAMIDMTKAITIEPENKDYYYKRGLVQIAAKLYTGAIADFDKAISLDMNFYDAYVSRGLANQNANDFENAMKDYTKAIKIDPNKSYAFERRGFLKFMLEDYYGSITDLNTSLSMDSESGQAYFIRGMAKGFTPDKTGGCNDLRKAGELGMVAAYEVIKANCN